MADHSILGGLPVEIWADILDRAIASPVLPFQADGKLSPHLVDNLDLFVHRCISFKRRTNIVLRLRSVCRTWYDILEGTLTECMFIGLFSRVNIQEWVPRRIRRLYIGSHPTCPCSQSDTSTKCIGRFVRRERFGNMELNLSTLLDTCCPNIKILMLDRWSRPLPLDIFARYPNITALSIDNSHLRNFPDFQGFNSYIPHVTHLHLTLPPPKILLQKIDFPSVRYLRLDLQLKPIYGPSRGYLGTWTFPSLQTLCLRANSKLYSSCPSWMTRFLGKNKRNILDLSIIHDRYNAQRDGWSADYVREAFILYLFGRCKNLTTMGVHLQFLSWIQDTRTSTTLHKKKWRTVIVHGLSPDMELSASLVRRLMAITDALNAEKIVVSIGWDDLRVERQQDDTSTSHLDELSNTLEGFSVPIVDQYFRPLREFIEEQKMLWGRGRLKSCVPASS
ncbi:hypothetical protein CPB86DRAFT_787598 [Serendipita vermifera]|nr:hypothetical protein CPB86DRAFT_787598 [Serendipita vermifera]